MSLFSFFESNLKFNKFKKAKIEASLTLLIKFSKLNLDGSKPNNQKKETKNKTALGANEFINQRKEK